jgi:hypothetical protein
MAEKLAEIRPPRALKGRLERRLWRDTAQILAQSGRFHAASSPLLSALVIILAKIERNPAGATHFDIQRARGLARSLGLR